nr:putative zinc finger and SCAN domain-containing protein 5C [Leptinotarsa decemlineata]
MAPSTDEYAISIKTEIETFDENVTLKSEEKYDALDVGVSENNTQEVDEELYCGLCGGRFINTMDYFGVEDLKVICYCENNESNAIHGEDVSQDLKVPLESTSDSKDILVDTNEDMSSPLNGKEFSNGNEHGVIHTPEQVDKEYQNEGTDLKSLRNRNTGKTPIQYESCTKNLTAKRNLRSRKKDHDEEPKVNSKICTRSSVNKSGVTNNLKTHTEVKYPLQCDMCPKSFLQSSVLKHHEKSHTWEHLFQSQKRNLKCYKKNCTWEHLFQSQKRP